MEKHRLLIVGAGRIGAGFNWHDDGYTHAGAARALKDRIELVGFLEPMEDHRMAAERKWGVKAYHDYRAFTELQPDIVSVCTQPEDQLFPMTFSDDRESVKAIWCEKPYMGFQAKKPVQVNYLRRADPSHQFIASAPNYITRLIVYGKDDLTTKCHFTDLADWWGCALDYRPFNGPCAYIVTGVGSRFFDNGGVNPGECMKGMLKNLLDHVDSGTPLWSPAR